MYLIDVGSATVKVYKKSKRNIQLIETKTFDFYREFTPQSGLSRLVKERIFDFFSDLALRLNLDRSNTKLFATGIFRDIVDKREFIWEFYVRTHLLFNIISHDLEAFYLEKAWENMHTHNHSLLIMNIGGKTTELIGYKNGTMVERKLLPLGISTILEQYTSINDPYSAVSLDEIVDFVGAQLPATDNNFDTVIYTGHELNYMQIAGYCLKPNTVFLDKKHPFMVDLKDYIIKNQKIFYETAFVDLQKLMPNDPAWMNGARACSALAQAICSHYKVKTIIPSDSDLIDGIGVQDVRSVVICGSFNKHLKAISQLIGMLEKKHITILSPKSTHVVGSENDFILFSHDKIINHCTWSVEALHMQAIEQCDLVIICNFDNYIGNATASEIGYAVSRAKRIVFIENNRVAQDYDIPSEINLMI